MEDVVDRIKELSSRGYFCSQIMMTMALDLLGKKDPDLIRAMDGIAHGCWFGEGQCGAWSGGACVIALYAGKGKDDEEPDEAFLPMLNDLAKWFISTYTERWGGITCAAIQADGSELPGRCRTAVLETYLHVVELLTENGYDMTVGK